MSIDADYLGLVDRLARALPRQEIVALHLPQVVEYTEFRDEFGFVVLSDGSVGPFYVSLDPVLRTLWKRYPRPEAVRFDPVAMAEGLDGGDLAERALAIGAFNALSLSLMRGAGYEPPDRGASKEPTRHGSSGPVGVVGYFCPVIDRLVDRGEAVLVLEKVPERVPDRPGVRLVRSPKDLAGCAQVLCTASVLINDTLDELLEACSDVQDFQIVGPTGSGLPDALFARGVAGIGGIVFDDPERLREVLARGESWGSAGRKYQVTPDDYPGAARLVEAYRRGSKGSIE